MSVETREYGMGTSMTIRYPWGITLKAKAMCSDGKVRSTNRIATTADTFFSIPASVPMVVDGKKTSVAGYITTETADGMSTPSDDDPIVVKFVAYANLKNSHALPGLTWRRNDVNGVRK